MKNLVLIHGRAQEHKDSVALKGEWVTALRRGLGKNGLDLSLEDDAIRFPYYGDTLHDLVAGVSADQVAEVVVRGDNADAEEKAFIQSVVEEVRMQAGITPAQIAEVAGREVAERGPLNWGWVRAVLATVDRRVPLASGAGIALATRDVYRYLTSHGVRDAIESGVRQALQGGVPTVVVAHSLGSVVAYNLLRREGEAKGWDVPLFVTVGSPLAVTAVRQRLRPLGHPACVGAWFNAMDARDIVALFPLDEDHFGIDPAIENKTDVSNHTANRHGIAGYLDDDEVARRIHDALTA